MKKILLRIRDIIVIVYDISIFPAMLAFLFLINSNALGLSFMTWFCIAFAYFMPECFHLRMFGDKLKRVADKVMGY